MAQQEEPLYDFPEPTTLSERKLLAHQRGRGSLKSINVLDRLLLTVPVWLQLSINPATALHILQREPPGTFLVRKSRTSQKSVLCVRLADDSMPSFVQQFGISEENSTLSLETSAISFPDLPRLLSFYCVSRDVLPFPLELPEAIAKATSHKELESISHMGIEFWNSHLNVRGPREAPKAQKDERMKPEPATSALPTAAPQTSSDSAAQPHLNNPLRTVTESVAEDKRPASSPTVFQKLCPITTRSPRELDCGSGLGALCFINPLFLQSQDPLARRRMFQRSVKIRVSTETATLLSPPIAPPPPPPLMPKKKCKCKAQKEQEPSQPCREPSTNPRQDARIVLTTLDSQSQLLTQTQDAPSEAPAQPPSTPHIQPELEEQVQMDQGQIQAAIEEAEATAQRQSESKYRQPSPVIVSSHSPSLSPYMSLSLGSTAPLLFPRVSSSLSPHNSPSVSPSLSPYQSPSPSPKAPVSRSPQDSACDSPSLSPHHSPSPSPQLPFSLSPFLSPFLPHRAKGAFDTPDTQSSPDQQLLGREPEGEEEPTDEHEGKETEANEELQEGTRNEEKDQILHMNATCSNNSTLCKPVKQCK